MSDEKNALVSGSLVGMLTGSFMLVIVFALILEQIGSPQLVISLWILAFAIGVYLFSAMFGKTMRFATFQNAGRNIRPVFGGMAIAAAVVSGNILILQPGRFYSAGTGFLSTYSGVLIGLALAVIVFSAAFARSSQTSIASIVYPQQSNRGFLLLTSLIVIGCSLCLLFAQLKLLELFVESFFGLDGNSAVVLVIVTAVLCLVFGGMQSLSIARVLGFSTLTIAFFVPLIWISYRATGNPLPQFSFGYGALGPIMEIDQEMIEAGFASRRDVFNPVSETTEPGFVGQFLATLTVAFGIAALPNLLQHFFSVKKGAIARHTGMWAFWLVLLFLTAIPAVALFAKLNVYTSVLGLQISEIAIETPWLFSLSANGSAPLFLICGQLVGSTADVLSACDRPGEAFVGIQDITINPDYLIVGLGFVTELPPILTTLLILSALICILTTIDGLLFVSAASITTDMYNRMFRPLSPAGIKLFMHRFFLIVVASLVVLFYPFVGVSSQSLYTITLVIGSATLFPALATRLWFRGVTDLELGFAMLGSLLTSVLLLWWVYTGPDFRIASGDELDLNTILPGSTLDPLVIGVAGLFSFAIIASIARAIRLRMPAVKTEEKAGA